MARKAVLEGGKRDEIITAAAELFFTEGYEKTSVRMILDKVNGEVGMFYHYFSSKEELFDIVADRFFRGYAEDFGRLAEDVQSLESFISSFLEQYEATMKQYRQIEGNMHWTVRSALHERTIVSLVPAVQTLLEKYGYQGKYPLDIAAGRIIADISAAIHSRSFETMNEVQKKEILLSLIQDTVVPVKKKC